MKFICLHPSSSAFYSTAWGALQALGQNYICCGQEEATSFARTEHGANLMKATRIPRERNIPLGLLCDFGGLDWWQEEDIIGGHNIKPFHWLSINSFPWRFVLCISAPPLYRIQSRSLWGFFPRRSPESSRCWSRNTQACKGTGAFPCTGTLISDMASYQPHFLPS